MHIPTCPLGHLDRLDNPGELVVAVRLPTETKNRLVELPQGLFTSRKLREKGVTQKPEESLPAPLSKGAGGLGRLDGICLHPPFQGSQESDGTASVGDDPFPPLPLG